LDVAKRVFQLYWVDAHTGEIVNRGFGREELIGFLAQRKNSSAPTASRSLAASIAR
jgi:hypothetical protein